MAHTGTVDYMAFKDTGCEYSPSCLKCPLPACKHDAPVDDGYRRDLYAKVYALRRQGVPSKELERQFRISNRTVSRIMEGEGRYRDEELDPPGKPTDQITNGFKPGWMRAKLSQT